MTTAERPLSHTDELLLDAALGWLEPRTEAELQEALRAEPELRRRAQSLRRTATLAAACSPPPAALARRLQASALHHFAAAGRVSLADLAARPPRRLAGRLLLALAAGLLLGLAPSLWSRIRPSPAPAAERAALLARAGDAVRWTWQPGPSPLHGKVEGDVVWSGGEQRGFLRLQGLPPLDTARQFQLWIVDGARPGSAPVDGGLFDLPPAAAGEAIVVPIRAALPVRRAAAFVVTVEERGGVVVSAQEHVVALAKP